VEDKELKVLKLDEMTNLIWIIFIALVVIFSIVLLEDWWDIVGLMIIVAITAFFLLPIICIILGISIMILSKLNFVKTEGNWGTLDLMKSFYSELFDDEEENLNLANMLHVKERRIVGIILLSGGIILSIIGLVPMYLIQDTGSGLGGIGHLIWLILIGLGIISMVMSISFFRKFEDRGWLEDALFYWSYWFKFARKENRKQQIDCSSCNQKLNIPFSYSGKISCPACGIYTELEEGIIQVEGNPSDQC